MELNKILNFHYGIKPIKTVALNGGWAALAYKISDSNNAYFLKVYEKSRSSTSKLTAFINQYATILVWLDNQTKLNGKIPLPISTFEGDYKCEDDCNVYLLYTYIDGGTVGSNNLSEKQIQELAEIISTLHSYGSNQIPFSTNLMVEDFELPFLNDFEIVLQKKLEEFPQIIKESITTYGQTLVNRIETIKNLSNQLKSSNLDFSLCHTDLHNWNLMQTDRLILIDWEGLKLAPVEADIMFLIDKPYFDKFISTYHKIHKRYVINDDALKFYRYRRNLEDIWEFIEQLLYEDISNDQQVEILNYINELVREFDLE
ncbi:aminoglycoside phosphotransferase family protein [Oceanobacillus sp. 1P07AA]|uniref:aminoglycoside phosphotransferase family protein n=1 Tax=Oceanobacillus sp. 1P07AA TaxID=3132293 RepID=UPI0039A4F145